MPNTEKKVRIELTENEWILMSQIIAVIRDKTRTDTLHCSFDCTFAVPDWARVNELYRKMNYAKTTATDANIPAY